MIERYKMAQVNADIERIDRKIADIRYRYMIRYTTTDAGIPDLARLLRIRAGLLQIRENVSLWETNGGGRWTLVLW